MEEFFFNFNDTIISSKKKLVKKYNEFLDSALFWKISIVAIPIFLVEYTNFFYKINSFLGIVYSLFSAFVLLTLIPAIYYKIKGRDFFKEMKKHFAKKNTENSMIDVKTYEDAELFPEEFLNELFEILKYKIFDKTLLHESLQKEFDQFFSFEYF